MLYDIISPLAEKDVKGYFVFINDLAKFIDFRDFVVIGNQKVGELVEQQKNDRVKFVLEDRLISYTLAKRLMELRIKEIIDNTIDFTGAGEEILNEKWKDLVLKRTGWYLQQFLKLSYSRICEDEYYLLWDADTVPLHKHDMICDGAPIFDMKTEYHQPYFDTFNRLFPDLEKRNERSYISEHMIVKTSVMREMLNDIEERNNGIPFYKAILNSISPQDLPYSGFADYETYGVYCLNMYPTLYQERIWDSLRPASSFYKYGEVDAKDIVWLLKDYDAMSFEAGRKYKWFIHFLMSLRIVQNHINCKQLLMKLHQFTI